MWYPIVQMYKETIVLRLDGLVMIKYRRTPYMLRTKQPCFRGYLSQMGTVFLQCKRMLIVQY